MKILVVYYSRTGNTRIVAESIAKELDCDIEEIVDQKRRDGIVGSASAYLNPKAKTTIQEMRSDPGDYDIVIIGTPIWWFSSTPAVNAYLKKFGQGIRRTAFFYTCDSDSRIKAFQDMERLVGKKPGASMRVESGTIRDGSFRKMLDEFTSGIRFIDED